MYEASNLCKIDVACRAPDLSEGCGEAPELGKGSPILNSMFAFYVCVAARRQSSLKLRLMGSAFVLPR